ncbi:hypothetical protein TDB9533_00696 [Thalassocella blandensis]|nr:hypothetical protein TDB9533_00696 [Thalassocella blandensis]
MRLNPLRKQLNQALLIALSLCLSPSAWSEVEHRFSGFATLGVVASDNEDIGFRRDLTQDEGARNNDLYWATDSLIGVQWHTRFSHKFDTTVQVVARDRFKNDFEKSLEWAFIRYRPVDGLDIRLGRLGSDIFMLSEYRQVGYAFQWVRPPLEFYSWLALYHFDGIDINKRFDLSNGTLNIKAYYGNTRADFPTNYNEEGVDIDFNPAGVSFKLEWGNWRGRYTYSSVSINNNILEPLTDGLYQVQSVWADAKAYADSINSEGKTMEYHEVGLGYDNNVWWAQTEYTELTSDSGSFVNSSYFYFTLGRRFGPVSLYAIAGSVKPEEDYRNVTGPEGLPPLYAQQIQPLVEGTQETLNGSYLDQQCRGLGVRWDFASRKALKFQVENYEMDKNGTNLWVNYENKDFTEDQSSTVISLTMDVLF